MNRFLANRYPIGNDFRVDVIEPYQPEFGLSEGERGAGGELEGGLLRLMAIGNQATEEIDEEGGGAAMAGVFDLGDVFELVEDGLDTGPFAQYQLIRP